LDGWGFVDALYFVIVTLKTVGYGDQGDYSSKDMMLFQSVYALAGIMLMGSSLGIVAANVVESSNEAREEAQRKLLANAAHLEGLDDGLVTNTMRKHSERGKRCIEKTKQKLEEVLPKSVFALAPSLFR